MAANLDWSNGAIRHSRFFADHRGTGFRFWSEFALIFVTPCDRVFDVDPISTAIIAGLAKLAEPAIKDAYEGLKKMIINKFGAHHELIRAVESLEKRPDSSARKEILQEEIASSKVDADPDLLATAGVLIEKLQQQSGGQEIVHQVVTGNRNIFTGRGDIHIEGSA